MSIDLQFYLDDSFNARLLLIKCFSFLRLVHVNITLLYMSQYPHKYLYLNWCANIQGETQFFPLTTLIQICFPNHHWFTFSEFFAFGIGEGASSSLIKNTAKVNHGKAVFIRDKDNM